MRQTLPAPPPAPARDDTDPDGPKGAPRPATADALREALSAAVTRAEEVLGREIAVLRGRTPPADLDDYTFRKSQIHLELARLGRAAAEVGGAETLKPRIAALRTLVEEDMALLSRHLKAVRRIAGILQDQLRKDGHDGTYAPPRPTAAPRERGR